MPEDTWTPLASWLRTGEHPALQATRLELADAARHLGPVWRWREGGSEVSQLLHEAQLARLAGDAARLDALPLEGVFTIPRHGGPGRLAWRVRGGEEGGPLTLALLADQRAPLF